MLENLSFSLSPTFFLSFSSHFPATFPDLDPEPEAIPAKLGFTYRLSTNQACLQLPVLTFFKDQKAGAVISQEARHEGEVWASLGYLTSSLQKQRGKGKAVPEIPHFVCLVGFVLFFFFSPEH